ncbi:n acetyltransferase [Trichuris trichiura]|uniref:N-alpha-acetyltransferase 20 n=1 Tax=Trichuris trichiura TaxID=36087 RepID=A0A077ZD35_TRITR|nr:n acetyltransferase [Trichuris trichiura]
MTTIRPFETGDLFKICKINLDNFTETYNLSFYMQYLLYWPELCLVAENMRGELMAYILGKTEGEGENYHGHITAVSTDPDFRRLGIAGLLMRQLEVVFNRYECYYVDLFVRISNTTAVETYKSLGYVVYRRVIDYYSGENDEDAYDMRKPLLADVGKRSIRPTKAVVPPQELYVEDV